MEGNTIQQRDEEMEIDLVEICLLLLHNLPLILSAGVLAALCLFLGTKLLIAPTYNSATSIYILSRQQESSSITYSDVQLGTQLTADYAELIQSRYVLEEVAMMAWHTLSLRPDVPPMQDILLDKHYLRKHGPQAYYGQKGADNA